MHTSLPDIPPEINPPQAGPSPAPSTENWYSDRGIQAAFVSGFFTVLAGIMGIVIYQIKTSTPPAVSGSSTNQVQEVVNQPTNEVLTIAGERTDPIVAKIACPQKEQDFNFSKVDEYLSGSGTLISADGLVLTNAHLLMYDEKKVHKKGCFVQLAGSDNAQEIYLAKPKLLEKSDKYNLAYLEIYKVSDDKNNDGQYPKNFSYYSLNNNKCDKVTTGDTVQVYGYSKSGAGDTLTVAEGEIADIDGSDIVINAPIDDGFSGGLVVGPEGCFIGVPRLEGGSIRDTKTIIGHEDVFDFLDDSAKDDDDDDDDDDSKKGKR